MKKKNLWKCKTGKLVIRCEFESCSWRGVLDTTMCDQVCQWLATGQWFSPGTPVSSTNKTDRNNITEIMMKVALNTVIHPSLLNFFCHCDCLVWTYICILSLLSTAHIFSIHTGNKIKNQRPEAEGL